MPAPKRSPIRRWARRLAGFGSPAAPGAGAHRHSRDPALDASLAAGGVLPEATCPACGRAGPVGGFTDNLRESGHCPSCGAWTRIRQLATVLIEVGGSVAGRRARSLRDMGAETSLRIYNTEARGSVHEMLRTAPGYTCSEYFGPGYRSGEPGPDGTRHEDLQSLSFDPGSFDLVISTDVFEHVSDPYRAHREVARVLRPGGHHVFTVPNDPDSPADQVRARVLPDGTIEHLAPPIYHGDPVRPESGALVFTVFGREMVPKLSALGFDTTVHHLWDPTRGLVGADGMVFDARKRA